MQIVQWPIFQNEKKFTDNTIQYVSSAINDAASTYFQVYGLARRRSGIELKSFRHRVLSSMRPPGRLLSIMPKSEKR